MPDPFDFLKKKREEEREQGPLDFLRKGAAPFPAPRLPPIETATERLLEGVGRGVLYPVRAFTDVGQGTEAEGGIAGIAGEFIGMGISYIPFFFGGRAVVSGLGLLKPVIRQGVKKMIPTATGRIVEGALSFGAFEAFAGEDVSEAPTRAAVGAAIGAGAELAFMGTAAAWRARGGTFGGAKPRPSGAPAPEVSIHPDVYKVERWLYPNGGEEAAVFRRKVEAASGSAEEIQVALMEITRNHMPGGQAILPGLDDAEGVLRKAKELGFEAASFTPEAGGKPWIFIADNTRTYLKTSEVQTQRSFMQGAQLTPKQLMSLIENEIPINYFEAISTPAGGVGAFGFKPTQIDIATLADFWKHAIGKLSTLAHEYTHFVSSRMAGSRLRGTPGVGVIKASTKGEPFLANATFTSTFPKVSQARFIPDQGDLWDEFWKLTTLVERQKAQVIRNLSEVDAVVAAARWIAEDPSYFRKEQEMISRAIEAMILDPKKAQKVAPEAVRLMVEEFIPSARPLRELMGSTTRAIDDLLRDYWVIREGKLNVFQRGTPLVTRENMTQWQKRGWFPGMEALVKGESVEVLAKGDKGFIVRNLATGAKKTVPESELSLPLFPEIVKRNKEIVEAVGRTLDKEPRWLTMWVRDIGEGGAGGELGGPQRLRKVLVDTSDMDFTDDVGRWIQENRTSFREGLPANATDDEVVQAILQKQGKDGLVLHDEAVTRLHLGRVLDEHPNVMFADEARSLASAGGAVHEAGTAGQLAFDIHLDDTLRALFADEGVPERALDYFVRIAKALNEKRLLAKVDPEVRLALESSRKAIGELGESLDEMATRAGYSLSRHDGWLKLRDQSTGAPVGKFASEEDAREFIRRAGFEDLRSDIAGTATPSNTIHGGGAGGGGARPPRLQEQPSPGNFDASVKSGRLFDVSNIFGAIITSMENFASSVETRGLGPALTRVFEPGQKAMTSVIREITDVPREALGNITLANQFKKVEKLLRGTSKERREVITDFIEYMSREEIARPGGLLERGMRPREIEVANFIRDAGLADDLPILMAMNKLAKSAVEGRGNLERTIQKMRQIRLSDEGEQLLTFFENIPRINTVDEAYELLRLSDVQRKTIKIIEDAIQTDPSVFSIMAVGRYASARPLAVGYKTGREQFAFEAGLTSREMQVAKEIDKIFESTFVASGLDPARLIGGYFPHLRKWADAGFIPDKIPGMKESVPDVLDWASGHFRSGALDIYNKDPLISAYRHARSLMMKKHFDPVLPDIKAALKEIQKQDVRAWRIMNEYVDELLGRPHQTFQRAQQIVDGTARALGIKIPETTVMNIVNSFATLSYGATIPFRFALIARNYTQQLQTVLPRVLPKNYFKALAYVTSPSTRREAIAAARKANAIPPTRSPLHAATELLGSPEAGKVSYRIQLMLERGFEWYKSADDFGRAVAYHAQRMRIEEHLGKYVKNEISLDEFAQLTKINTFKTIDASRAKEMFRTGRYEEAIDFLGMKLAREAHFRYGMANHPAGWNSIYGRLYGQFGSWPVQYKDYVAQGLSHGSAKDRAEFVALSLAVNGSMLAAGGAAGVNLMSWVAYPSFTYTGGPFADMTIDAIRSINGSDVEKGFARMSLMQQVPVLGWAMTGDPRSVFVPGSYLLGDLVQAGESDDWLEALAKGAGFKLLEPSDDRPGIQWILDAF